MAIESTVQVPMTAHLTGLSRRVSLWFNVPGSPSKE